MHLEPEVVLAKIAAEYPMIVENAMLKVAIEMLNAKVAELTSEEDAEG